MSSVEIEKVTWFDIFRILSCYHYRITEASKDRLSLGGFILWAWG
jgi:hypothetical protein